MNEITLSKNSRESEIQHWKPIAPSGPAAQQSEASISAYWKILQARKGTVLAVAFIVFGGIALGTFLQTPKYRATGLMEIRSDNAEVKPVSGLFSQEGISESSVETQFGIFRTESLAKRVVDELKLMDKPEFNPAPAWWNPFATATQDAKPVIERFQDRMYVEPVKGSRLVRVSFDSQDPQLAAAIVNSVFANYVRLRTEESRGAETWLTQQISATEKKLASAEQQLHRYATANGLQLIEGENGTIQNLGNERIRQIQTELAAAQAERFAKESLLDAVRKKGGYGWQPSALDNPVIQSLTVRLAELRRDRAQLASTFTEDYPKLQQINEQIKELEGQLSKESSRASDRVANDFLAARRREDLLLDASEKLKAQMSALSEKSSVYNLLRREVETGRQLYSDLQQKLKDVQVGSALKASNIGVVDSAIPPVKPNEPNVPLNLALGAMAGLVFGVGFAFVSEHMDDRIKTTDELNSMGIATLAMIPSVTAVGAGLPGMPAMLTANWWRLPIRSGRKQLSDRSWSRIDRQGSPQSVLGEAFGSLRTSFLLHPGGDPPRTLLITGCQPGDGKTTVSVNLAIALAQLGRKVLLIDGDTRKPSVHRAFTLDNRRGLTTYLTGEREWRSVVQPNVVAGLNVLPSGRSPEAPAILLSSDRMKVLLAEAQEEYDFVLLDSPALFINAPDARILANIAEATIVVARSCVTTREALRRALELAPRVLGVVLNDLDVDLLPDYYRSYYSYGIENDSKAHFATETLVGTRTDSAD